MRLSLLVFISLTYSSTICCIDAHALMALLTVAFRDNMVAFLVEVVAFLAVAEAFHGDMVAFLVAVVAFHGGIVAFLAVAEMVVAFHMVAAHEILLWGWGSHRVERRFSKWRKLDAQACLLLHFLCHSRPALQVKHCRSRSPERLCPFEPV